MPFIEVDNIKIFYNDMGEGDEPALMYISGWCDSRNSFNQFAFACAKKRRIIALDWRGHGKSGKPKTDFGFNELVEDALAVIKSTGIKQFITVAKANGGWAAIELKKRLKNRIPKMVFIDWQMFQVPESFLLLTEALQNPKEYNGAREMLFNMWLRDVDNPEVIRLVRKEMASYGFEMWARSAREISAAYRTYGSPINLLNSLHPHVQVLHLYSQPDTNAYLLSQENFAASNRWFRVRKLNTKSHFLTIEVPELASKIIEEFITGRRIRQTGT